VDPEQFVGEIKARWGPVLVTWRNLPQVPIKSGAAYIRFHVSIPMDKPNRDVRLSLYGPDQWIEVDSDDVEAAAKIIVWLCTGATGDTYACVYRRGSDLLLSITAETRVHELAMHLNRDGHYRWIGNKFASMPDSIDRFHNNPYDFWPEQ
jgi:hypothetical protein